MEKTITLNDTQVELLKSFMLADAALKNAEGLIETTSPTLDPWSFHEAKKALDAAFSVRLSMACGFAMCVAADFK